MSVPTRALAHAPCLTVVDRLEEDLLSSLQSIALLPIKTAGRLETGIERKPKDTEAGSKQAPQRGVLREDGPGAAMIHRCALAWVSRASATRYSAELLAGLEAALHDLGHEGVAAWLRRYHSLYPAALV